MMSGRGTQYMHPIITAVIKQYWCVVGGRAWLSSRRGRKAVKRCRSGAVWPGRQSKKIFMLSLFTFPLQDIFFLDYHIASFKTYFEVVFIHVSPFKIFFFKIIMFSFFKTCFFLGFYDSCFLFQDNFLSHLYNSWLRFQGNFLRLL